MNIKNKHGHLPVSRKFFKNFLWNENRVFSKAEAYLDLIQTAKYKESTVIVNGKVVNLKRGQLAISRRFLEKKWKWGSTKVLNFLNMLKSLDMANHETIHGQTILTLCNYETYNGSETTKQTTDKPATNQHVSEKENKNKPRTNHLQHSETTINTSVTEICKLATNHKTNHGQTTDKPRTNQYINKENKENKENKYSPVDFLLKKGASKKRAESWVEFRKRKKFSVSETVTNNICKISEEVGTTLDRCLEIHEIREWQGFTKKWLIKHLEEDGENRQENSENKQNRTEQAIISLSSRLEEESR